MLTALVNLKHAEQNLCRATSNFTANDFGARHARFKVKTDDPNKPLLTGTDVRIKFSLDKNTADISPEVAGVAAIDFPFAQFKTSIPEMHWDIAAKNYHEQRLQIGSLNFCSK